MSTECSQPKARDTHFKTLYINREDSHKECVDQEPMSDKHHYSECAELTDGTGREKGNNTQNGIVTAQLQRI